MPRHITFSIDPQFFSAFPGYRRAILVATGADNSRPSHLDDTIAELAAAVKDTIGLDDPRIAAWREAFATLGIKTRDFRPSVEALIRRIHNDKPLGSISPLVDISTVVSLDFVMPTGAHPILLDTTEVRLTRGTGTEVEPSDGTHPDEQISTGEPILLDGTTVATRRWVWRQTSHSRISRDTHDFYLNIDALAVIDQTTLEAAVDRSQALIRELFGVDSQIVTLSAANPVQTVSID